MVLGGALHHRQLTITVCRMRPERVWSILLSGEVCFCEAVDSGIWATWTFFFLAPDLSNIEQATATFLFMMMPPYNR